MPADKNDSKHKKHCSSSRSNSSSSETTCKKNCNDSKKCKKDDKVYCVEKDKCKECDKPKVIHKVPVIISKPGKYCVTEELLYKGSETAITIAANNVTLDLAHHDLIIRHPSAIGISIIGVREVVVKNDAIKFTPKFDEHQICGNTVTGVLIRNSSKVLLDHLYIKNISQAILIDSSDDITVKNSHIENACTFGIRSLDSRGLVLENITFKNNSSIIKGGTALGAFSFIRTDNISFENLNSLNGDIFYGSGTNAVFRHLNIIFNDSKYFFSAFQLGSGGTETPGLASNVELLESNIQMQVIGFDSDSGSGGKASIISFADNVHYEKVNLSSVGAESNEDTAVLVIGRELLFPAEFENSKVTNFKLLASNVFAPEDNPVTSAIIMQPGNTPDLKNEGIVLDNVLVHNPGGQKIFNRATNGLTDTVLTV